MSDKIRSGIIWKLAERFLSMFVTLFVNVVLARILAPAAYGELAMVSAVVYILQIFVSAGLGNALIQKKDTDELDFSSIFWINMLFSIFLYLLIFLIAPFVGTYFGYPSLIPILRVFGLQLPIAALNSVQCAFISRKMLFRYYFFSTLSGKILSGCIGIVIAVLGGGVWALVTQAMSLIFIEAAVLWFRINWRPKLIFSWERVKALYSFAYKIMLVSFISQARSQIKSMIIGKRYTATDLAYYNKGSLLPSTLVSNISSSLNTVMFPVLSQEQDHFENITKILRRWMSLYSYIVFPMMFGFIVAAKPIILLLFTEKWAATIPFFQLSCAVYLGTVVEGPIRETVKSLGLANICLRMQLIKTSIAVVALVAVMRYGVMAIAVAALVCKIIDIGVSAFYANKYAGYGPLLLIKDIGVPLLFGVIMCLCAYPITLLNVSNLICLTLQVMICIFVYVALSIITKNSSFAYCNEIVKKFIKK